MQFSTRLDQTPGIFSELKQRRELLQALGRPVLDLSVGTPDMPPAQHIMQALAQAALESHNYIYALGDCEELTVSAKRWYQRRFSLELEERQIISLLGSQEGLAHIALALLGPGDMVIVPDPGYPIFEMGPKVAGAKIYRLAQRAANGYLMDINEIPRHVAKAARMMIVSYPNNPTAAVAPQAYYDDLVRFAQANDILILHDNAYCELTFDGRVAGSFLQTPGAAQVGVEFNSLSKTYNMAGCRVGFALGNHEVIQRLRVLKSNIDYGMFLPIQRAAIAALDGPQEQVVQTRQTYQSRRDLLVDGFEALGWSMRRSPATMFIWAPVPQRYESAREFAGQLAEQTGIIVTPGDAFGGNGEGFVRMAMVQPQDAIKQAFELIKQSGFAL